METQKLLPTPSLVASAPTSWVGWDTDISPRKPALAAANV